MLGTIPTRTTRTPGARGAHGTRMLAAVALAGAAALLAGCATAGEPDASTAPSAALIGADPVPLDDALLQDAGLLEGLGEPGIAARWVTPGESIAIIVGGSGAGGDCIPQPHATELEPSEPTITVRFDPPNPDTVCTMDYRLHGWELALAEPVDASGTVPVRLVNSAGKEEVIEVELGPDDVLAADGAVGPTADPQPSEIPDGSEVPAPAPIPEAELPDTTSLLDPRDEPPVAVRWLEPGRTLAVLLGGSGSPHCVPQPIGATVTGLGAVEVAFEYPTGDMDCSADFRPYGWSFPLPEAVSATLPVEVTVAGAGAGGATATVTLQPGDVLDAG